MGWARGEVYSISNLGGPVERYTVRPCGGPSFCPNWSILSVQIVYFLLWGDVKKQEWGGARSALFAVNQSKKMDARTRGKNPQVKNI